jgi:hypothetical protein
MPNHCHNDLWIEGPEEEVAKLLAHVGADKEKPEFDFDKIIAYPELFRKMDDDFPHWCNPDITDRPAAMAAYTAKWGTEKDGFNIGGYDWCVTNWGTKWNAYEIARRDYDGDVCVTFQTAWAPPRPVIAALHKAFPKCGLSLEYFEQGGAYCGGVTYLSQGDWEDYYEDERGPFAPGEADEEWYSKEYRGKRGG